MRACPCPYPALLPLPASSPRTSNSPSSITQTLFDLAPNATWANGTTNTGRSYGIDRIAGSAWSIASSQFRSFIARTWASARSSHSKSPAARRGLRRCPRITSRFHPGAVTTSAGLAV